MEPLPRPRRYGFLIDNRRCIGCHACTVACKAEHDIPVGVNRTWVKYVESGAYPHTRRSFHVLRCNHCAEAPCIDICPTGALFHRDDGIVDFDTAVCIACKACTQACPYDALYIDPATVTAQKCNYCAHRVESGLLPSCVVVCPTTAIVAGDLNDPESAISRRVESESVTVRKAEKGTRPRVFYVEGRPEALDPTAAATAGGSLWSAQELGVGIHRHLPHRELPDLVELLHREQEQAEETRGTAPRRTYDSPAKGVPWGGKVTAYVVTKAAAAGISGLASLAAFAGYGGFDAFRAYLDALVLLALTLGLLVWDLGRPGRFWMILRHGRRQSWLVRGAWILAVFGFTTALAMAAAAGRLPIPAATLRGLHLLNLAAAAAAAVYTAYLLRQCRGRDAWAEGGLAPRMAAHGVLLGTVYLAHAGGGEIASAARWGAAAALTASLALAIREWFRNPTSRDADAAHALLRARPGLYWGAVVGVGHVLPLGLLAAGAPAAPLVVACVLVGVTLHTDLLITLPQKVPLA